MLNGQTLKSATSDYDQRHVIAFRPISVADRSWSYDNKKTSRRHGMMFIVVQRAFLANVNSGSRSLYAVTRPSVVCLSVVCRWCKIEGKLLLSTNRKSYMSFRLVSKSVTLNDLERRNGRYFALFQRIRLASGRTA